MVPERKRYFIGLVPPSPIFEESLGLKRYFKEHFNSKAALNSPPHITLHMPFEWKPGKEDALVMTLHRLATTLAPVEIVLQDFDCFAPRVIFIKVIPSANLLSLQQLVRMCCKKELGIFNADYKDLPFHPHVTLAFRDLKKQAFQEAWSEFKDKTFKSTFVAKSICLLKRDGKRWEVYREFGLGGH